jgi:hypothetical protein
MHGLRRYKFNSRKQHCSTKHYPVYLSAVDEEQQVAWHHALMVGGPAAAHLNYAVAPHRPLAEGDPHTRTPHHDHGLHTPCAQGLLLCHAASESCPAGAYASVMPLTAALHKVYRIDGSWGVRVE